MTTASAAIDGRMLLADARKMLIEQRAWQDYAKAVSALGSGGFPYLTYVGLNFTERAIKNFKFYFSFFRRLRPHELAVALPVPDRRRFDGYYAKWQATKDYSTIHRGVTFALKVASDGSLTHYYHMRLPGRPAGDPARLMLSNADRNQLHGVCEEFTGSEASLKRYFYCKDPRTIRSSLETAGFQDLVSEVPNIEMLEYIESDRRDKMTWITDSRPLLGALVERRGPRRLDSALEMFCRRLGYLPYGPGSARDARDHSVYFVLPTGQPAGSSYVFDGVKHFMTHYLHLR